MKFPAVCVGLCVCGASLCFACMSRIHYGTNYFLQYKLVLFFVLCLFFSCPQVETRTLEEVHEVLQYASQTKTSLTRIMLDNMVVPLPNGDVEVSMLREAVDLINGRFETEVSNIC